MALLTKYDETAVMTIEYENDKFVSKNHAMNQFGTVAYSSKGKTILKKSGQAVRL